ncbi:pyridoxal-phosphate-dependent aminotransferase family protein [Paraburkholderia humisilvae]|uniref:Pyridoxamine--pyruvate transaminase n=1 Tax=Paraburkholderia humisilvae TaxID=627669 RepID=A0A6J5DEI6_9BURK|nr:aminotransferase class V-fold PLP-dependent enzyme [Paraburkholderia humisilvae]CAB3751827.1 Pyridoxamine--pyruvate transaminase [Paraburkholderia humisilvae]
MSSFDLRLLLDPPRYPANRYAPLADRIKRLLATHANVVFVQAEAILALEAVAISIARPGRVAVNVVTSPYGAWFGTWLSRGGAGVHQVSAAPGQPIDAAAVSACLERLPQVDIIAAVHAESSNGALNPLAELAALARSRDALFVVDAVASVGGHPIDFDQHGIDIAVIGAQKALAGPAGVSGVAVSARAWAHIAASPDVAPSSLSLMDLKRNWLERGRLALPGMPPPLEFWALEAALDRVEAEGIEHVIARHRQAARASRAGLRALGIEPWIARDEAASALVTSAPVPTGVDAHTLIADAARMGVELAPGYGEIEGRLVRLDHTGTRAKFDAVLANVTAYGTALERQRVDVDIGAAARAVNDVYAAR